MNITILTAPPADEGPDPSVCILCTNVGAGCPYHGRKP